MRFTKRDMEIIGYLRDYDEVDMTSMSEYLEVAVKTLRNQLRDLAEALGEYGISIEFLSGNRVQVRGHGRFAELMNMSIPRFEMEFERRLMLLLTLHDDFLIIQEIADALLVSKSYAEKQLAAIMKKYPDDIQSQRHYGIRYTGTQDKRRGLFVKIMFPYLFGEDYEASLRQFHELHFPLFDYFTDSQLERARKAVHMFREIQWFRFTDESMQQLFLYVLFLARHGDSGSTEQPKNGDRELLRGYALEGLADWLREMCQALRLPDSEEEICYLHLLLLSLRKQRIACQDQIQEKMSVPVRRILEEIQRVLRVDLTGDEELIQGLSGHLYTTVLRGEHMNVETDPYTVVSMKRQYPFGFEMAAIALDYLSDMYKLSMKDEDLVYLAVHFQAAIERMKDDREKTRIIIVCHFGTAAAQIIRSKIERKLSGVKITGMYSLQEFTQLPSPECDCIVTTERILKTGLPVIYISMALPEREMKKIEEQIREIQIKSLLEMSMLEAMILHPDKSDVGGIITSMVQPLIEEDFVEEGYLDTVLDREKISSTSLSHIAVPHGSPTLVHATRLVVGRLKQPVLWDDSRVCCVFLFAVSSELLKERPQLFNTFYRVFANPEVEEMIRKLQTEENLSDKAFRQRLFQIFQILR